MPGLSRKNAAPLLRMVGNRTHATNDDHVEQLPTPPATGRTTDSRRGGTTRSTNIHAPSKTNTLDVRNEEEDITRSPVSSDDENLPYARTAAAGAARTGHAAFHTPQSLERPSKSENGGVDAEAKRRLSTFRQPPPIISSPPSTLSKRSNEGESASVSQDGGADMADDDDAGIFGAAERRKRQKSAYGGSSSSSSFSNIHAPKRKERQYGKSVQPQKKSLDRSRGKSGADAAKFFKKLPGELRREERPAAVPLPQFKKALGADIFEFKGEDVEERKGSRFRTSIASSDAIAHDAIDEQKRNSLSPSLSPALPPSSPEINEIGALDIYSSSALQDGSNYETNDEVDTFTCSICNETMPATMRRRYIHSDIGPGHGVEEAMLNYKWQQRFCRWHRGEEAQRLRTQREYPEVDWEGLSTRMTKFHAHLRDVLRGKTPSIYRDRLAGMIRDGSKTAKSAVSAGGEGDNKAGTETGTSTVGYYGPKGERVMTEHIIANLSDEIRKQSTKDHLVAAVGVSGGVSGFVQALLVPELAEQLVREDMDVSSARAREIMVEGAELGELLYPDANDLVEERMEDG